MLSATYALVALSVEQANVRMSLASFETFADTQLERGGALEQGTIKQLERRLEAVHESCHLRKVDLYLMRAVRSASREGHLLLAELESLNHLCFSLIAAVRQKLHQAGAGSPLAGELRAALRLYCKTQLSRLEKEERELFSLARRVLPNLTWFSLAEKFLQHETRRMERRQQAPGSVHAEAAPAPCLRLGMAAAPKPVAATAGSPVPAGQRQGSQNEALSA